MADRYEPELGQAIFGQPAQELSCSVEVASAMTALSEAFDCLYPRMGNPFCNSGARYKWSCFEVHAYAWGDEDQPFNFKWRDFIVSWYKYNGRGMSCNRKISEREISEMMRECMMAMAGEEPEDVYV